MLTSIPGFLPWRASLLAAGRRLVAGPSRDIVPWYFSLINGSALVARIKWAQKFTWSRKLRTSVAVLGSLALLEILSSKSWVRLIYETIAFRRSKVADVQTSLCILLHGY